MSKVCWCIQQKRIEDRGAFIVHRYQTANHGIKECKAKWKPCPARIHIIAECRHGLRFINVTGVK